MDLRQLTLFYFILVTRQGTVFPDLIFTFQFLYRFLTFMSVENIKYLQIHYKYIIMFYLCRV